MNCEDFEKEVMSQPNDLSESILDHSKHCEKCAEFFVDFGAFETHIHDALQVPIPPTIQEDNLAKTMRFRTKRRLRHVSYALAASVMFMIGLAMFVNLNSLPELDAMIVAHIEKEPFTLTTQMNPSSEEVKATLASMGVSLKADFSKVRFVKRCMINDELAAHFVVEGEQGPVTVIVMPNETLNNTTLVNRDQLQGMIMPLKNKVGSVAVVGYIGEPIDALAKKAIAAFEIEL